ncbi:OmpA family protein [Pseudoroseomonas cervicalis]|uniref:OmpA family protein n=1 Tax=Teichococcus cervicalis TaxID=204525 RepID=UPI00278A0056|nr:OmpA family protein [Pseudoroseomonas cervicalis]MDQ1077789.1 OOP family OmpA-OmpF porin [Pseudoroseomonas cervicalis]
MPRPPLAPACLALLLGLAAPVVSQAQAPVLSPAGEGAETQRLIEQLRPRTRGIRLPSGEDAVAAPAGRPGDDPAAAAAPAAPPPTAEGPALAGNAAVPPPRPGTPETPRLTTAPPEVPAVSITVHFATGSATLSPDAVKALAPLGRALNSEALGPYRFRIEGHTDTVGSEALNQSLSGRRALAVRELLVRQFGVNPARLEAVGYGQTQLLVPTPDQVPEPRNRRVQVLNLGG